MRSLVLGICLLFVTACDEKSPLDPTPVDRQIVLAPGENAVVAPQLSVRFMTVLGDSRCPADAICIMGGDAIVRVEITAANDRAERDLHTGNMQPVSHQGVTIELVSLAPYPFASRPIQPADYRATLRVTR